MTVAETRTKRLSKLFCGGVVGGLFLTVLAAAPAFAATCNFNSAQSRITLTLAEAESTTVATGTGGQILINGVQCQTATVANTNTINVSKTGSPNALSNETLTIDQTNGAFARSATDEVKWSFDGAAGLSDAIVVMGTPSSDNIRIASATEIDLNNDTDVDITLTGVELTTLDGQGGNDNFDQGSASNGAQTLTGGGEIDTVTYASRSLLVTLSADGSANDGEALEGDNIGTDIENLVAGNGGSTITGTSGRNILTGGAGNDIITAGAGNDVLVGGGGDDTLDGGDGTDVVSYANSASAVTVDLSLTGPQNTGGAGSDTLVAVENLLGSPGADSLTGNGVANVLSGGAGNDTISGGAANDSLIGGAGNDTLTAGDGTDVLNGGAGDDTITGGSVGRDQVDYSGSPSGVTVDLSAGTATGGWGSDTLAGIEDLRGSNFNDSLTGDAVRNVIYGLNGDDLLFGLDGNDHLHGGGGSDTCSGGAGTNTFLACEP